MTLITLAVPRSSASIPQRVEAPPLRICTGGLVLRAILGTPPVPTVALAMMP
jgi:hypothetical protein